MRFYKTIGAALLVGLAMLLSPDPASGQYEPGQWRVTTVFGVNTYDDATPFETAGFVGGEVFYSVNRVIGLGFNVAFSRPQVDGSYFPRVLFQVAADTTVLFEAGYQSTEVTYNAVATVGAPLDRFYLYALGGVGGYTIFMDPQSFRDVAQLTDRRSVTSLMFPLGAGINYSVSDVVGVTLEVRDDIFTDFQLEDFNPVAEAEFRNTCEVRDFCILEANDVRDETSETVHNIRFSIGFVFTPGR